MSSVLPLKTVINIGGKSLLIIAALNFALEYRNFKLDRKLKRLIWDSKQTLSAKLFQMLKQFIFLFGQLVGFNIIVSLNYKRVALPVSFVLAFLSSYLSDVNVPMLVSSFVLTRIGFAFLDRAIKLGIIKHQNLIFKGVFVILMTLFNAYIILRRDLLPRRILKNYLRIGRLSDLHVLEFDLLGKIAMR